jgi:hypothetical protein
LKAAVVSMCTSSMMYIFRLPRVWHELHRLADLADLLDAVVARAVDLEDVDEVPPVISTQAGHCPQGLVVGPARS